MAHQLLARHGIVTRDVTAIEQLPGGFSAMYPVLRRLEETGRIRRGYFVAGLGAAQFAQPGAVDLLRDARDERDEIVDGDDLGHRSRQSVRRADPVARRRRCATHRYSRRAATRTAGARVVIVNGRAAAWISRGDRQLVVCVPDDEPERSRIGRAMARELVAIAHRAPEGRRGWLIEEINGKPAIEDPASQFLIEAGFASTGDGPAAARAAACR